MKRTAFRFERWLPRIVTVLALLCGSTASAQGYKVGDVVECNGERGRVVGTEDRPGWPDPFYLVEVQGAGTTYQYRCVSRSMKAATTAPAAAAARTTTPAAAPSADAGALCRPGAKLEGQWGIQWYAVTVKGRPDTQGRCPIGFDGYGAMWDTALAPDQLRPRGGGPITRPERPVADEPQPAAAAMRDGVYSCHKISPGGALMHVGKLQVRGGRGRFDGMPDGWTVQAIRSQGANAQGRPLVVVEYTSAAGWRDRLDCVLE